MNAISNSYQRTVSVAAISFCLWIALASLSLGQDATGSNESSRRSRQTEQNELQPATEQEKATEQENATPNLITTADVDEEIAKVEKAELEETEKGQVVSLYVEARQLLALAATMQAEAAQLRTAFQNAEKDRETTRENLDQLDATTSSLPLENGEIDLTQKKREIEKQIEEWEEKLNLAINTPASQTEWLANTFPGLVSETQTELEKTRQRLLVTAPDSENPLLTRGRMVRLQSKKQKLETELELLSVKRDTYEATANNFPLKEELAKRQLEVSNKQLKAVQDAINESRKDEIQKIFEQALAAKNSQTQLFDKALDQFLDENPTQMSKSVEEVVKLNEELGLVRDLQNIATESASLAATLKEATTELAEFRNIRENGRTAVQEIGSEFETMQARVNVIGLSYEIGTMLRRDKTELVAREDEFQNTDVATKLPLVQANKYDWQDKRSEISKLLSDLRNVVTETSTEIDNPDKYREQHIQLLIDQRKILQKLGDTETDLLNDLLGIRTLQSQYSKKKSEYADFLDERILWVRSEPVIGTGDYSGIERGSRWLAGKNNWSSVLTAIKRGANTNGPSLILISVGLLGLLLLQPKSRSDLRAAGEIAAKRGCREFSPTVSAFLQTLVLAILWPSVGLAIGWLITNPKPVGQFALCIGKGLTVTSMVAFPVTLLHCVCKEGGLAHKHFSWTEGFRKAIRKHAIWFMILALPLLFLTIVTDASNNSDYARLGRVLAILLLAICIAFSWQVFSVFRVGGAAYNRDASGFDLTASRLRAIVFVIVILGFALLILFAAMGYFESVLKIGSSLLQTIILLIGSVIIFGFVMRFFLVRRRKLRFEQLVQQRKAALAAAEKQAKSGMSLASEALDIDLQNEAGMDITDVSRQARELTGVIFLIVLGLSLLAIWQYLLPATKILDSWELWRITVDSGVEIVTARDLLLSLVAFALTFFGVRNIPGMLELLLLQRLPLDAGARYAVASILRYILLVVGVIVALSYLKIPWSNYSWLVAAISVGLGFGLQEIVANFVSGLILLLERPVRVGDVVTIDGVTGIVSRIQMRATTVTNWDNQELVVPNKDLISGKLLNWTLSSVINRIALKVGVAYGTDVAKVREIITKIVDRHPDVLHDPPPVITFEEFGDSSLNFVIRCCTTSIKRRWHLVDEINSAVNEAFEREGIEIPFPQRVLHMIQEDESPEIEDEN